MGLTSNLGNKGTGKKVQVKKVPVIKVHKTAWIGKKKKVQTNLMSLVRRNVTNLKIYSSNSTNISVA